MKTKLLHRRLLGTGLVAAALCAPASAAAYFSPEEVLLNKDVFLPPSSRETQDRVAQQAERSADRREAQLQDAIDAQHGAAPDEPTPTLVSDTTHSGEPTINVHVNLGDSGDGTASDLELLRTIRLLSRIEAQQRVLQYDTTSDSMHAGAPADPGTGKGVPTGKGKGPLTPTGAGAWMSAIMMLAAVYITLRRSGKQVVVQA